LTTFGLVVALTFDLLTSESNQFIFDPIIAPKVVNLVKLTRAVCKISCWQTVCLYDYARTYGRADRPEQNVLCTVASPAMGHWGTCPLPLRLPNL